MKILIVDFTWKGEPYDMHSLSKRSMGGSEATLCRVATALAKTHDVTVLQNSREQSNDCENVRYTGQSTLAQESEQYQPDICIVMRKAKHAVAFAKQYPSARTIFWAHDYLPWKARHFRKQFLKLNIHTVGVSHHHQGHLSALLYNGWNKSFSQKNWSQPLPWNVSCVPNIVHAQASEPAQAVNKNKLVFFSSPQKGLPQVLSHFQAAKQQLPELELLIANPGYKKFEQNQYSPDATPDSAGVRIIGELSQADIHKEVETALCVFYPQNVFPETFGLVFAEAHALGTPVLAHDFGSASELLSPAELVNAHSTQQVVERLLAWQQGDRPVVSRRESFTETAVAACWTALFERLMANN